jgi:hypothetical protein
MNKTTKKTIESLSRQPTSFSDTCELVSKLLETEM